MPIVTMKLPDLGEGVAEAELVDWAVEVGDTIAADDTLATVMTDKAAMDIPSPASGVVTWRAGEKGDLVPIGSDFVRIDTGGTETGPEIETDGEAREDQDQVDEIEEDEDLGDEIDENGGEPDAPAPEPPTEPADDAAPALRKDRQVETGRPAPLPDARASRRAPDRARHGTPRPQAAPAVRRRAAELGIDLATVRGSGPGGRILHEDLGRPAPQAPDAHALQPAFREIPLTGLRRLTAERVAASKAKIPHFTIVEEVDVTDLEALRASLNDRYAESRGKLTILPFVVRALVLATAEHPGINGQFDDEARLLRLSDAVHVGVATQTDAGLMVPVLHHAERSALWEVAGAIVRLAERARQGHATRDELTGSTITVTSLGALGGIASTPIINAPELAIIGVNRIATRSAWIDGAARPRQMMNLSCSFDHRVIDGWAAAVFLQALRRWLEAPALILAEDS
jgi:2-oxoisovalerate dehydrogenase E2 component (dihydrolipoyl transacylase)